MSLLDNVINAATSALGATASKAKPCNWSASLSSKTAATWATCWANCSKAAWATRCKAWIGTGSNASVDAAQIQNALGGSLSNAAAKCGLGYRAAQANLLAQYLPNIINAITPNGNAADADGFGLDDIARIVMQNFLK